MNFDVRSIGLALFMSGTAFTASANDFYVSTTLDRQDANPGDAQCDIGNGTCSLRAAVQEANALGGEHIIDLKGAGGPTEPFHLSLTGRDEGQAAMGDLDVCGSKITINGSSAVNTIIDGLQADRIFDVIRNCANTALILNDLTLRNGFPGDSGGGGAIRNGEFLVLNRVDIYKNEASFGGGISNQTFATARINASVIRENHGRGTGGGIGSNNGGVTITNSILEGNSSPQGGGIHASGSTTLGSLSVIDSALVSNRSQNEGGAIYLQRMGATITNSTISGNWAASNAGGVYATAFRTDNFLVSLIHATVTKNEAAGSPGSWDDPLGGSGVYVSDGVGLKLTNSIVADNISSGAHDECRAVDDPSNSSDGATSAGSNLIIDSSCGVVYSGSDIGLANLSYSEGGPTPVHALLTGSDALDAASSLCTDKDQRGYPRLSICDIGAYEDTTVVPGLGDIIDPLVLSSESVTGGDNGVNAPIVNVPATQLVVPGQSVEFAYSLEIIDGNRAVETILMEREPEQGSLSLEVFAASGYVKAIFNSNSNASGSDSFAFRVCDSAICSELVEVDIYFSETVSNGGVSPTSSLNNAIVNDSGWIDSNDFSQQYPDAGYSHPAGVFFFHMSNVSGFGATLVVDVPQNVDLPDSAVVRVLNSNGEWESVGGAVIDTVNRTIALPVFDNLGLDQDVRQFEVSGQVVLAVIGGGSSGGGSTGDDSGSGSSNTGGNSGSSSDSDSGGSSSSETVTLNNGGGSAQAVAGGGGGGGSLSWVLLMLLPVFIRRRGRVL